MSLHGILFIISSIVLIVVYLREKFRTRPFNKEAKAALEILIHDIRQRKTTPETDKILESWIKNEDLHPEKVESFNTEEEMWESIKKGKK
jgi:hypothetical protein